MIYFNNWNSLLNVGACKQINLNREGFVNSVFCVKWIIVETQISLYIVILFPFQTRQ